MGQKYLKKEIYKKIHELELNVKNISENNYQFTENERCKIIDDIRNEIFSDASSSILLEIENRYSENVQKETQFNQIKNQLDNIRMRLKQEISALGRRGNVNLVIGVLTTVVAVGILTSTVLDTSVVLTKETLVSYFIPRLFLSIFIEIFSFFFLKLYKSGLSEIKYFQNELTNVEMKFVSLENALRCENSEVINAVISELSRTERNFILDKGQSTVELERSKLDVNGQNDSILNFTKLIDSIKK